MLCSSFFLLTAALWVINKDVKCNWRNIFYSPSSPLPALSYLSKRLHDCNQSLFKSQQEKCWASPENSLSLPGKRKARKLTKCFHAPVLVMMRFPQQFFRCSLSVANFRSSFSNAFSSPFVSIHLLKEVFFLHKYYFFSWRKSFFLIEKITNALEISQFLWWSS